MSRHIRRSDADAKSWGKEELNWIAELQVGTFQVGTQLDAIGYIQIGEPLLRRLADEGRIEGWVLNRFGTEAIPPIVERGVLADVAKAKGV